MKKGRSLISMYIYLSDMIKSLYIHIPFCRHICNYCDFTKMLYQGKLVDNYLIELKKELICRKIKKVDTVHIGGGSPSVLELPQLELLLSSIQIYLHEKSEFAIEVNPEDLNEYKIALFKKYNINRVSIGVQTFNEKFLTIMNRHHHYKNVELVINLLKKYNIDNISLDLIYGLAGQTLANVNSDLELATSFPIKHLSYYSLSVEPNTIFYLNKYKDANEDLQRSMYEAIYRFLSSKGFKRYEVSNYCLPDYESKHNLTYWHNQYYYGVGVSAAGYNNGVRYQNTKSIHEYLKGKYVFFQEEITENLKKMEQVMLSLRLAEGLNLSLYAKLFNENILEVKREVIDKFLNDKLLIVESNHLKATDDGMIVLNYILQNLF